ncbi:hypothetical protein [Mycoplasma sp. Z473B]|uniref:hypothetical protein n=1 Tax=Mycoplasma sp. Z473B TaxID=3401667 RepID=UPI003AAEE3B6
MPNTSAQVLHNYSDDIKESEENLLYKTNEEIKKEKELISSLTDAEYKKRKQTIEQILNSNPEISQKLSKKELTSITINSIDISDRIENNEYDLTRISKSVNELKRYYKTKPDDIKDIDNKMVDEVKHLNSVKIVNRLKEVQKQPKFNPDKIKDRYFDIGLYDPLRDPNDKDYDYPDKTFHSTNEMNEFFKEKYKDTFDEDKFLNKKYESEYSFYYFNMDKNKNKLDPRFVLRNTIHYYSRVIEVRKQNLESWLRNTYNWNITSSTFTAIAWGLFAGFTTASFFTFGAFVLHAASAALQASFMTYFTKKSWDSYYEGQKKLEVFIKKLNDHLKWY